MEKNRNYTNSVIAFGPIKILLETINNRLVTNTLHLNDIENVNAYQLQVINGIWFKFPVELISFAFGLI